MDPVAQVSRHMVAARARETERPYRLFDNPLVAALAGPEGSAWLDRTQPTLGSAVRRCTASFAPASSTTFYSTPPGAPDHSVIVGVLSSER